MAKNIDNLRQVAHAWETLLEVAHEEQMPLSVIAELQKQVNKYYEEANDLFINQVQDRLASLLVFPNELF